MSKQMEGNNMKNFSNYTDFDTKENLHFESKAVHGALGTEPLTGAVSSLSSRPSGPSMTQTPKTSPTSRALSVCLIIRKSCAQVQHRQSTMPCIREK